MGEKILLVDDDEEICEEIKGLLQDEGFRVTVAGDGEAAINLFDKKEFDLMILDLKIPGISGIEILRHVKGRQTSTKVLVVTGKPMKNVDDQCDQYPDIVAEDPEQTELLDKADGFVGKPFDVEILLARIKSLV
jgi:DNA-binding response OmpR family regulator